jgi:hypothetical protein
MYFTSMAAIGTALAFWPRNHFLSRLLALHVAVTSIVYSATIDFSYYPISQLAILQYVPRTIHSLGVEIVTTTLMLAAAIVSAFQYYPYTTPITPSDRLVRSVRVIAALTFTLTALGVIYYLIKIDLGSLFSYTGYGNLKLVY